MPKIIKDINENILNAAMELFGAGGYETVEMRSIAKKLGIAVGTLYNYYPNKEKLFIMVFEKSWDKTFKNLEDVKNQNLTWSDKLNNYIQVLYEDMENRKGLGRELTKFRVFDSKDNEKITLFKRKLLSDIEKVIDNVKEEHNIDASIKYIDKLTETLIVSISALISYHSDKKEENIKYLNELIIRYIENNN